MTAADIRNAVAQGGRFVLFQYCFSVLIMSFKRSSPIFFLRPGEGAFSKGATYSLISLFAGWWGIPWGPIWTLTTLATNFSGGRDVTSQVLSALGLSMPATTATPPVTPAEAAKRKSRQSLTLWFAWGVVALIFLGMACLGYKIYENVRHMPRRPGEVEFKAANARIGAAAAGDSGNTTEAAKLASTMSGAMKVFRAGNFEQAKEKSWMDEHDQFKTYCDLTRDHCVFLIHVPELRRFDAEAQKSFGQAAWMAAQTLLDKTRTNTPGLRLAVGLRGIAAYNRVLTGKYVSGATDANSGILNVSEDFGSERELYSWFADMKPPSSGAVIPDAAR